jgi:hypothetical protein
MYFFIKILFTKNPKQNEKFNINFYNNWHGITIYIM